MNCLLNEETRVVVQGITGKAARFHTSEMLKYGTKIVAGVTPYRGGSKVDGVPVYDTVREAVEKRSANTSIIFVPAPFAKDAIFEAIEAHIPLIICITEHIPILDMLEVKAYLKDSNSILIGPNCPGMIAPGISKVGIMPGNIHQKGSVGIISRSGTLTYEAVSQLSDLNIGQSIAVGIGGDPLIGTDFLPLLENLEHDLNTKLILLIGEIGGASEEKAAQWIKQHCTKPVVAFISGITAPQGKRMGHAGAIVSGSAGTAEEKIKALKNAGVTVVKNPAQIGCTVEKILIDISEDKFKE